MSASAPRTHRHHRWLLWLLAIPVALLMLVGSALFVIWAQARQDTTDGVDFRNRLAVPPLAASSVVDGRRVFDLRMQAGRSDLGQPSETPTWGINGDHLGPTVRVRRDEAVGFAVSNDLPEATTLHWHGMHLPAAMDGGPHQMVEPGDEWRPAWTVDQPAATLWYHPHLHGKTAEHVYRGLAGMLIVDDDTPAGRALPHDYGIDDVPVILQDKAFDDAGRFTPAAPPFNDTGILGDTILVNGTPAPYHEATTSRVRLRLLNASTARIYDVAVVEENGAERPYALVGTDGGLLPRPLRVERVLLSPGERAEVVIDVRPGERLTLRSIDPDVGADPLNERFSGSDDSFDVLQLRAAPRLTPSPEVPAALAPAPDLDTTEATTTRRFELGNDAIDGRAMDLDRIDEVVTVGDTEIWEVTNNDGPPHNFHVHDVQFQVLDLDGRAPSGPATGWKDTVLVTPGSTVRLVMRFTDYTDPDVPYMFHCHLLRHEDRGMMGQFVVVRPGQAAGTQLSHAHHTAGT